MMGVLDRYGERIEIDEDDRTGRPIHDAKTCPGFVGEDDDGRPLVCWRCKRHLAERLRRQRRRRQR